MKKNILTSFFLLIQFFFLTTHIFGYYSNPYYQYNQTSPYNQSSYDPSRFIYPNRTAEEKKLTGKIEKAFQNDPILAPYASSIQVYTIGQEVTLNGLIDSDRIKLRAESKAKNTLGVQKVINNINVEKTK